MIPLKMRISLFYFGVGLTKNRIQELWNRRKYPGPVLFTFRFSCIQIFINPLPFFHIIKNDYGYTENPFQRSLY